MGTDSPTTVSHTLEYPTTDSPTTDAPTTNASAQNNTLHPSLPPNSVGKAEEGNNVTEQDWKLWQWLCGLPVFLCLCALMWFLAHQCHKRCNQVPTPDSELAASDEIEPLKDEFLLERIVLNQEEPEQMSLEMQQMKHLPSKPD